MKKIFIYLTVLATSTLPQLSFAWGADGHQTVGAIADALLVGTKAGAQVKALVGNSSLEKISVWADCVKGISPEKDFAYTSTGRYAECAPFETASGIAAMADYVKRNDDACHRAAGEESCHKQYHYADVSLQHTHYQNGYTGTSDHDVVHAIQAAALVLQGKPQPSPFDMKDKAEALTLITHYIGDIHQPLHVASVFLNADGKIINPDEVVHDQNNNTVGGNALQCPCGNFHALWDDMPVQFKHGKMNGMLIRKARSLTLAAAPIDALPVLWADDAIRDASLVFGGAQFSKSTQNLYGSNWSIGLPLKYEKTMQNVKEDALARAGAHLAQLLQAIWPE